MGLNIQVPIHQEETADVVAEVARLHLAEQQIKLLFNPHGLGHHMVLLVALVISCLAVMEPEAVEELPVLVLLLEAVLQVVLEVMEDKIYIKQE